MEVDKEIFKSYDNRGHYSDQITPKLAYHLGHVVVTYLGLKQVVIGRDMKLSDHAILEN